MAKREWVSRIGELEYARMVCAAKFLIARANQPDVTEPFAMCQAAQEEKYYGELHAMLWYTELPFVHAICRIMR